MVDYDAAKFWFDVAQFVLTLGVGFYVWATNRHRVTAAEIADQKQELATVRQDLATFKVHLEAVPRTDVIHDLSRAMTKMDGDIRTMVAKFEGLESVVRRVEQVTDRQEEYLLNAGVKR